ncbi:MAG: molybdopterin-dependent oxidoreductase [Alphaproteobacteria bacterium]|nr:molybdopterin-dependent oxidoreductase [Alphaproteobacteria bacterium]
MTSNASAPAGPGRYKWIGKPVPRKEDAALLSGRAQFIDDIEPVANLKHAAILRSPHAHARILKIDASRARALPGVTGIVSGAEVAEITRPIPSVVKTAIAYYPIAVDKVRFVGEPVAVVVAEDRYIAEDALDLIEVAYEPLAAAVDPLRAMEEGAPLLHDELGSNVAHRRSFEYGEPDAAFDGAEHLFALDYRFPKYASTPIETFGVTAHYLPSPDRFTVWSNFQGPFVLHPLMARALGVPGNRLRLITPPASGGSFGIKQAVFTYITLLAAVSRILRQPVKWTEDRLEHLMASSSAADRVGRVEAAFKSGGELVGLRFNNICNMGAYVRAPEPASVYRMQATSNGCYGVRNIAIENILVVTNQMPTGLNRGFGGPQFFFALERMMDLAAKGLGIDPADLRRRNFIAKDSFPYLCPGGSLLDSGDYTKALDECLRLAGYPELKAKREQARKAGRLFGIGFAVGLEPSGSNMGYVSLAQTAEERALAEPKSGANSSATISMDPTGSVTVQLCSTPNGQGHATVAAQIVAERLGIEPDQVDVVTEIDTQTSAWSIASGNYANRFAAQVSGAVSMCADKVADKLKLIALEILECDVRDILLADGAAQIAGVPEKSIAVRKLAAAAHWNPVAMPERSEPGIHETVVFSPPTLTSVDDRDRVSSAVTYGSVFDLVALEIEPATGRVSVDKYVSLHDVGTMLNPLIVNGQIHGGFAHGFGCAMLEEIAYDANGNLLSGTFADYLCPTAADIPALTIGHLNAPSPMSELGCKGLGDGSSMLTPAAMANAVADALDMKEVELPLNLHRVWQMVQGQKPVPASALAPTEKKADAVVAPGPGVLSGEGETVIAADRETVWRTLLDPDELAAVIPGCEKLTEQGPDRYAASVTIGIAGIKGGYEVAIELKDKVAPESLRIVGRADGALGHGSAEGWVTLAPAGDGRTALSYRYNARVGGKVAAVGQRMLGAATRILINQFFNGLNRRLGGAGQRSGGGGPIGRLITVLAALFGGGSR